LRAALKTIQQTANRVVIAGSEKGQAAFSGMESKAEVDAGLAFEIVLSKAAEAQTRMNVGFPKAVADGIDRSCDLASPRFRKFSNIPPKGFCQVNLQDRPRDFRCIS
jgi:hypothetical protein